MKPKNRHKPSGTRAATTLRDLADEIHHCFVRFEDAATSSEVELQAAQVFDRCYRMYLVLGGKPFQATNDHLKDLIILEEQCRGKMPSGIQNTPSSPTTGEWSEQMSKARIRAALGLDSYYALSRLAEQGVYQLKQDPLNRQRWTIRLDTLDPEIREKFKQP